MRKMFTRLFSLTLVLLLFGTVSVVHAQLLPPTTCGSPISADDVVLVTSLDEVCDSSDFVTFEVVGYPGAEFVFNYNGTTLPATTDSSITVIEGIPFKVQIVENDTCVSNVATVPTNLVDSIEILKSDVQHPTCGETEGLIQVNFDGGYTYDTPANAYAYSIVPSLVWDGTPHYYAGYQTSATNIVRPPGTYFVAAHENKSAGDICLVDLTNIAAWDTVVINPATDGAVVDSIVGDDPLCFNGTTDITVGVSGGTEFASFGGVIVELYNTDDLDNEVAKDTAFSTAPGVYDNVLFEGVSEGSYVAIVSDSLGCDYTSDSTLVLVAPDEVKFDIAIKSVDCFGGNNGEITAFIDTTFEGYDPTHVYQALLVSLDPMVDDSVYTFETMVNDTIVIGGLYPIYYALFVKDSTAGCDSVEYDNPNSSNNYISLQSPGELSFVLAYENDMDSVVCFGDSIWVWLDSLDGGSGYYDVRLNNASDLTPPNVVTNFGSGVKKWLLPAGVDYRVWVRDSINASICQVNELFTITGNDQVTVTVETTDPICAGQNDGLIEIIASGGTGTYEYSIDSINWYNYNVFNVPATERDVYARDKVCPENVGEAWADVNEIENVIEVDYNYGSDTLICNGSTDGSIVIDLVSWSGVGSQSDAEDRNIRAYYTTDLDSIYDSGTELDRSYPSSWDYVEWTADDLTAGTYYIWAVDTFGCVFDTLADGTNDYLTVEVKEYDELELFVEVVDSASCAGTNDGTILLTMSGGSMPDWYFGSGLIAEKSAAVQDDTKIVNCDGNLKYGVATTYQQALLKDVGSLNCWPVEGNVKTIEQSIEKSASADPAYADEVYINVTSGMHYVVLYDTECDQRVIVGIDVFGYGEVTIGDIDSVTDIVCYGDSVGQIIMDPATGGSGTLLYTLYKETKAEADTVEGYVEVTEPIFSNLAGGNYYVKVSDEGEGDCGTDWSDEIEVWQPALIFDIEVSNISCNGEADGSVLLTLVGADTITPMFRLGTSNWRPFDTYDEGTDTWSKIVNVVEPREYTVYAIDSAGYLAGCTGMAKDFEIVEPDVLEVTAIPMDTTDCSIDTDGYITVTIEGGKANVDSFEVQLTGIDTALIARDSVLVFEGLDIDKYELIVTEVDAAVINPCIWKDSIDVFDNGIVASAMDYEIDLACKGDSSGVIELDITGGTGVYLITINKDTVELDANNQITGLPEGDYVIFIQDSIKGAGNDTVCTVTLDTVVITEPAEYLELDVTKIQDITCLDSGMFSLQASGGEAPYSYYAAISKFPTHMLLPDPESAKWQEDSIFTVGDAGTWVVWVMDANGCITGGEYDRNDNEINEWRVPIAPANVVVTVNATLDQAIDCNGDLATIIVESDSVKIAVNEAVVPGRAYKVWFEDLDGTVLAENDSLIYASTTDTAYVVAVVKDTLSGCFGVDTILITQPEELMAVSLTKGDGEFTCPDVVEGYIEAYAMGGTKPYTYQLWQGDSIKRESYTADYSFLVDVNSSYSFVVMDAKGCTDTLDVSVPIESADPILFDIMDVTCSGDTAASVKVTVNGVEGRKYKVVWRQYEVGSGDQLGETKYSTSGEFTIDQMFIFDNESDLDQHYEFQVIDSLGCESDLDSMTFDQLITDELTLTVVEGEVNGCGTDVTITPAGGVAPYTLMVNDEVISESLMTIGGGVNYVTVVDFHGCSVTDTLELAYPMSMDTTVSIFVGDTTQFVYGTIDEMLTAEVEGEMMYTFYNVVDTACTEEVEVTVMASVRMAPAIDSVTPMDTIETNHAVFTMVFENEVMFNDSVMGYLTVTAKDSADATLEIPITSDMVDGNTITVDYDYTVVGALDVNTTYVVAVDSGIVTGDGLAWDGVTGDWMFTTGSDYPTGIENPTTAVEFKVYPNPFNDHIKIENYDKLTRVVLTNIAGQRVLDIEYPSYEIRTGNLVTGVYVVTLIADDKIVKSERIIKR